MANETTTCHMTNKQRLIDANALNWGRCPTDGKLAKAWLDEAPTVDAVEVVHGTWLVDDYDSGDPGYYSAFIEVHCSKCGYNLGAESGTYGWLYGDPFPMNYCPNCGAKMDGDGNA